MSEIKLTRTERFVLEWLAEDDTRSARQYPRPPWSIGTKSRYIGGAANRLVDRLQAKRLIGGDFRITEVGRLAIG